MVAPSNKKTAGHESGHAIVFAALGIPVVRVQIQLEEVVENGRRYTRYGWTQTDVDSWSATSGVSRVSAFIRRCMGNAAGVVGEVLAGVYDADSDVSARSDFEQVSACLLELGVLRAGEADCGVLRQLVGLEAAKVLDAHRQAFDQLRCDLESSTTGACQCPELSVTRTAEEDEELLERLHEAADEKRRSR